MQSSSVVKALHYRAKALLDYATKMWYLLLKKLKKKKKEILSEKAPVTSFKHVRLLQDNAPDHRTAIVTNYLQKNRRQVLPHPPHTPDLASCDIFLVPKFKIVLAGRRYWSRQALGSATYQ